MEDGKSESKYNIRWDRHGPNTMESLNRYLRSESLTDMVLSCDGYSIKCHRLILAASSYYFERLLSSRNYSSDLVVILKDISCSEMVSALHFMYHGKVILAENEIHAFLKIAENLELKGITVNEWDRNDQHKGDSRTKEKSGGGEDGIINNPEPEIHITRVAESLESKDPNAMIRPRNISSEGPPSTNEKEEETKLPVNGVDSFPTGVRVRAKRSRQRRRKGSGTVKVLKQSGPVDAAIAAEKCEFKAGVVNGPRYKRYTTKAMNDAMDSVRGGMSCFRASTAHNIPCRTLYEKMKKLGISKSDATESTLDVSRQDMKLYALLPKDKPKLSETFQEPSCGLLGVDYQPILYPIGTRKPLQQNNNLELVDDPKYDETKELLSVCTSVFGVENHEERQQYLDSIKQASVAETLFDTKNAPTDVNDYETTEPFNLFSL